MKKNKILLLSVQLFVVCFFADTLTPVFAGILPLSIEKAIAKKKLEKVQPKIAVAEQDLREKSLAKKKLHDHHQHTIKLVKHAENKVAESISKNGPESPKTDQLMEVHEGASNMNQMAGKALEIQKQRESEAQAQLNELNRKKTKYNAIINK